MDRVSTFRTFVAGALVGAGAVYFAPPATPSSNAVEAPGGAPAAPAGMPPPEVPSPPVPHERAPEVGTSSDAPPPPVPASETGERLERHLAGSSALWNGLFAQARGGTPVMRALAPDIEAHVADLPLVTDHLPPVQLVASYLVTSQLLLARMAAAGMDVALPAAEIGALLHPSGPRPAAESRPVPPG